MKILLIGNSTSYLAKRLTKEAILTGDEFTAVPAKHIKISITDNKFKAVLSTGEDLLVFDVVYFYALGKHLLELAELAKYLKSHGKIIVEDYLAGGTLPLDKLDWRDQSILATPDYQFFFRFTPDDYHKVSYPAIIKTVHGSRGQGIFKVTNKTELRAVIKQIGRKIIIQKYLPITADYRIIVIGSQAYGAVKRFNSPDDFLTTRKRGERVLEDIAEKILELCVSATHAKGLEIAGLDLVRYQDKYYIWEINSSPQCRSFEKYTGVNVAGAILQYLKLKK